MAGCGVVLLLAVIALTEAKVVFHRPDTLEVEAPEQHMLFIHEPSIEETLRQELQSHTDADTGSFTEWMNMDHPRQSGGATGDYEWVREARYRQRAYGECMIPCADDQIEAMEVDVLDTDEDNYIVENCLGLEDQAYRPSYGFFCMNTDQMGSDSKCMNNPVCQEKYMGSNCQCPDFQVRYFCMASGAEQQQFCDNVVAQYQSRRNRSYYRNVRDFAEDNGSETDFEEEVEAKAEEVKAVAESNSSQDKVDVTNLKGSKKLLELLRTLLDEEN